MRGIGNDRATKPLVPLRMDVPEKPWRSHSRGIPIPLIPLITLIPLIPLIPLLPLIPFIPFIPFLPFFPFLPFIPFFPPEAPHGPPLRDVPPPTCTHDPRRTTMTPATPPLHTTTEQPMVGP